MYKDRIPLYQKLEEMRKSKVLVYVTGDRRGLETRIHPETHDFFVQHLDKIGDVKKISLYLYTTGGLTLAAWSLINLIRQFCEELEIIIPSKAHSAGTLMCLAANKIIMTKQATLGPIDPSVQNPLNPQIQGAPPDAKVPVSVEDINAYNDFARETLGVDANLNDAFTNLVKYVHPLVLGHAYRARGQIRMLGEQLISNQIQDKDKIENILKFLCSESGSHDYTINRKEAKERLGLPIENPDDQLYNIIINIYNDISNELELNKPYNPNIILGSEKETNYRFCRALIESIEGGHHYFVSEGKLVKIKIAGPQGIAQEAVQDFRYVEEWRYDELSR